MFGHYIGDAVMRYDMSLACNIIGAIIELPKTSIDLFKVGWSDGSTGYYSLKDIRLFKYNIEDATLPRTQISGIA